MKFLVPLLLLSTCSFAQSSGLKVGDRIPVKIWQRLQLSRSVQLVILDFWFTGCGSCIASFPEIDRLQQKFDGKVQFILVNYVEDDATIGRRLKIMKKKLPEVPSVSSDTIWHRLFPNESMPYHVWIARDGRVLATTYSYNATKENISKVLNQQTISLAPAKNRIGHDLLKEGFFSSGHPAFQPLEYSGFVAYSPGIGTGNGRWTDTNINMLHQYYSNMTPSELIHAAFGYDFPLKNESSCTDCMERPKDNNLLDKWKYGYLFSYELRIAIKDSARVKAIMQQDVNRFFGARLGIQASLSENGGRSIVIRDKSHQP